MEWTALGPSTTIVHIHQAVSTSCFFYPLKICFMAPLQTHCYLCLSIHGPGSLWLYNLHLEDNGVSLVTIDLPLQLGVPLLLWLSSNKSPAHKCEHCIWAWRYISQNCSLMILVTSCYKIHVFFMFYSHIILTHYLPAFPCFHVLQYDSPLCNQGFHKFL